MTITDTSDGLKHGLYLQNAPQSLGALATPATMVEYAVEADRAGWDGVFLADALGGTGQSFIDPWITMSAIAGQTEQIRLGTWITPVPRRQPWQLASNLATLDAIADGRVIFGAGLGAPWNYETTGIGYEPRALGDRYDEALDIITELWHGDEVYYDGDHFQIDGLELATMPVQQPRIPTVMGCWWPNKKPLHRAADWDGLMPVGPSFYGGEGVQGEQPTGDIIEETEAMLRYYREVAGGSGDVFMPIDVPQAPPAFVDVCRDLDVSWTLAVSRLDAGDHDANLAAIRSGPP